MGSIPRHNQAKRSSKQGKLACRSAATPPISAQLAGEDTDSTVPSSSGTTIGKRRAEKQLQRSVEEPDTQIVFEDPFGDEFEEEQPLLTKEPVEPKSQGQIFDPMTANDAVVFRPGRDKIAEDEKLICDETAYDLFHKCMVEWPALSFDYVCMNANGSYDNINAVSQDTYPLTISAVLGTQADRPNKNRLVCLRMSNLHRTSKGQRGKRSHKRNHVDSEDESSSEEESEDEENGLTIPDKNPIVQNADVRFDSTVNRLRVMPQKANIVAAWGESGRVSLLDLEPALDSIHLDSRKRMPATGATPPSKVRPFYNFGGHGIEGFALDWSRVSEGRLLSGALNGSVYLTEPSSREGASWVTNPDRFRGHRNSVEDIQWSPNERDVFVSCSSDKAVLVWDARDHRKPVLGVSTAHDADVNVVSWNHNETHLLVSGGDDGVIKVWDMRCLTRSYNESAKPAAEFKQHQKAITCVHWHPTDSSMLCAGSEDGTVSIWDLAVERDEEEELREGVVLTGADEFPPQLLFIHMGQSDVKDAQWHPGCTSVVMSTAAEGLNIFQPSNIALPVDECERMNYCG